MSRPTTPATPRLRLRPFAREDVDWVHAATSDPELCRYTEWGPNTPEDTRAFLAEASAADRDSSAPVWAVTLVDGTGIGAAGVWLDVPVHRRASFGYWVGRPHQGQGHGTEVARALVAHAHDVLGAHRVEATCHPDNAASARVIEKAGLVLEGRMRGHLRIGSTWRDSLLFARIAEDPRP